MASISKFICFHGIDGSGKTTQALWLQKEFKEKGIKSKYVWIGWHPTILKPLTKFIKSRVLRKNRISSGDYAEVTKAKKAFFSYKTIQQCWFYYVIIDYYLQVFFRIYIPKIFGYTIICDRYIEDVLIYLSVNYSFGVEEVQRKFKSNILKIFPVPDLTFFLSITADVAFKRKDDISSIQFLNDRIEIYNSFFNRNGIIKIDGSQTKEEIHQQILIRIN